MMNVGLVPRTSRKAVRSGNGPNISYKKPNLSDWVEKAASIQKSANQIVRVFQVLKNGIDLSPRQNNWKTGFVFGSDDSVYLSELLPEDMSEEEQGSIESLIL